MSIRLLSTPSRPYKTYRATSLAQVMSLVRRRLYTDFETIFRGQASTWPLVPSIGRTEPDAEFGNVPSRHGTGWYSTTSTPGVRFLEEQMFQQFQRMAPAYDRELPSNLWELLAVAQHHRLPTRLLDWTSNPYVAMWFVVSSAPLARDRRPGVLWIFVPDEADYASPEELGASPLSICRESPDRPVVFRPRFVNLRIRAQQGLFTVHQFNHRWNSFRPIDLHGSHRQCLTKILVPATCFELIREELDLVGVNAASLFPDLDGLSRSIADALIPWPAQ